MPLVAIAALTFAGTSLMAAQADAALKDRAPVGARERKRSEFSKVDYVLQPLDILKVQVLQEEEINRLGEVRISQEYTINLPLIGAVDLKGKTAQQAREIIRERYDRDYLVDPQVQLQVIEYGKRFVNVIGQVNKPGEVQFPQEEGLTLVEAISRAGGQTRLANLKKVVLKRTNFDGTVDVSTINVEDLMKTESTDTYPLRPGDVITVPERSI
ncbi:MAG: polysaccharide export protein [Verrucomicrobia bacterium]|nr:polysaccharide export protein [Verrucomicrobiota bacterium]